jgi:STE24 endopeptidase
LLTLSRDSKNYSRLRDFLALAELLSNLLFIVLMIGPGSKLLFELTRQISTARYWRVLIYSLFFMLLKNIFLLPLHFYSGYVVERRFGLSNENIRGWVKRSFKRVLVELPIAVALIVIFYVLLDNYKWWWLWVSLAYFIFSIFLNLIFPYIVCLFYKLSPISDEELCNRLKILFRKSKFKLTGVYKLDLSKETKKANAALVGIGGTKRILLADNLLNKFPRPEIESVVAHELEHYQYSHIKKGIIINGLLTLLIMYSGGVIVPEMIKLFSLGKISDLVNFPILLLYFSLLSFILLPLTNGLSRRWEYQADNFAARNTAGGPCIRALERLAELGLVEKSRPRWSELILHNHPSIKKRISAIKRQC